MPRCEAMGNLSVIEPKEAKHRRGMEERTITLPKQVATILTAIDELETEYPGRKFTMDGHMMGSIGEVIAAKTFGFKLLPASSKSHDAICTTRGNVQIKITGIRGSRIIFNQPECDHLIVLKITSPTTAAVIYDGRGKPVCDALCKPTSTGQRSISISRIRQIATMQP